jgi:hypothetical protein
MPNIEIYDALGRQLRVLYADILDQGVPPHHAAIVALLDIDPVNFAADSPSHHRRYAREITSRIAGPGQVSGAAGSAMARSSG